MQTYGRQVAEAILGLNGYCDAAKDLLVIDDRGISLSSAGESMPDLCWVPARELDGPDPLDVPSLPFPFSPEELAAFMIDGPGVVIPSVYGDLSDGPHEDMLGLFSPIAIKAKEALLRAYESYRTAVSDVGGPPIDLQRRHQLAVDLYERQLVKAEMRMRCSRQGRLSHVAFWKKKDKARDLAATHYRQAQRRKEEFALAWAGWRRVIVRRLYGLDTPAVDQSIERDIDTSALVTADQLIKAFRAFTGMDQAWFQNHKDVPALGRARKVAGQGQRHPIPALYCPYEVVLWLTNPRRKKGKAISVEKAWEIYERKFPRSYAQNSIKDPR